MYRRGLYMADRRVVQTRRQQRLLRESFGLHGLVIPMPCAAAVPEEAQLSPGPIGGASAGRSGPHRVLWAGRVSPQKRVEWLFRLADALPDLHFDVVGPVGNEAYAGPLLAEGRALRNVRLHGRVPFSRMGDFYRQAALLCCTSVFEGFPNTYLEAWSYGLPVVATFDPDGLIAEKGLGAVGHDLPALAQGIRELLSSPARWKQCSTACRSYFLANHTVEAVMPRFEQVFLECAAAGTGRS